MAGPGRPGPAPLPREHGTMRGYRQHRSRGEVKCPPCLLARAAEGRAQDAARAAELCRLRAIVARLRPGGTS